MPKSTYQNLAPAKPAVRTRAFSSEAVTKGTDLSLQIRHDDITKFIDLYMRFIHDRPHSMFHKATLWAEIKAGTLPECLVFSICATGCRFSPKAHDQNLTTTLREKASSIFAQQLETVSLSNIQTCVLLANLYAAEPNNELEALYFGIANRMSHILRLHEPCAEDPPILREVKCRIWWTLFMADRWCPPGLGLRREINFSDGLVDLPMSEMEFQNMDPTAQTQPSTRSDGLWKYNVTLVDVLGPIQDLNHSLVRNVYSRREVDQQVEHLAQRLQKWVESLPERFVLSDDNLERYRREGFAGTYASIHLGYHHYSTLLYFQYLDASLDPTPETVAKAANCRFHALSFSQLLRQAREMDDCHVVFLTIAHMTMVSSSVLLHMLLFGEDGEVEVARTQLTSNFEALIALKSYWPVIDTITRRLLTFQTACLGSSTAQTHRIDRWMIRFLLEYAIPLEDKKPDNGAVTLSDTTEAPNFNLDVPSERTKILNDAFEDLCR